MLAQPHVDTFIRSLLVHAGVLSERDEYLERMTPWLAGLLAKQPAHHQVRTRICSAVQFLHWLDDQQLSLDHFTQGHVDTWLALPRTIIPGQRVQPIGKHLPVTVLEVRFPALS
ncbi:hypothetical protein [Saccharopolyspora hattusasensis]|uniref:hypothetical protein n=1 Tax=Saccharopolyspora hattusasensis TaxID=1128679 RepID=UPI003D994651